MKKLGRALLIVTVASSLIVTPVFAEPSVSELESGKAAAESEMSSLQSELTRLLDKMGKLEEDLIAKGEEIIKAEEDLKIAEEKETEQYEAMKLRIKYMYENGDTKALEALFSASDFSDLLNKAEYVKSVHTYDREQLKEYVATKEEIKNLKQTLETEQTNLESMQAEYQTEEQSLNTTIETKSAEIAEFDSQIQAAAEAAAQVAREREEAQRVAQEQGNVSNGNDESIASGGGSSDNGSVSGGGSNAGGGNSGGGASSGNTSTAQTIVNAAYGQLGVPYVWGGTSPGSGLDCSGLVQYCHSVAGISLPRVSQAQGGCGVAVSSPQPGDMVCYGTHIGIYIGGGQMIHAPKPGDVVKISNVYGSPWYRRCW